MASFLSEEWFEGMEAAWSATEPTATAPAQSSLEPLVLQHMVSGGPDGDVCYHVRVLGGRAQVVRGWAERPDVTFTEDYGTAAAIASGRLSAPAALLAGQVRVAGDLPRLVARQADLAADDPVPAAMRASTTY